MDPDQLQKPQQKPAPTTTSHHPSVAGSPKPVAKFDYGYHVQAKGTQPTYWMSKVEPEGRRLLGGSRP